MISAIKKSRSEPERNLDDATASLIKGMLARGDKQSDIAAFFGINGGRVAEINTHQRFQFIRATKPEDLPPRGPYLPPVAVWQMARAFKDLRTLIDAALGSINDS
jgi:hypothetical protein